MGNCQGAEFSDSQALLWTCGMVGSWLQLLGLAEYKEAFAANGVDGETLLYLRKEQFANCLGVVDPHHLCSLWLALNQLKRSRINYTNWEWSCEGVQRWLQIRGLGTLCARFKRAAVHGGVLFSMPKRELGARYSIGENGESELVLESLWLSIARAKQTRTYLVDPTKNVNDWGIAEVEAWLRHLNLGHLAKIFEKHAVNGTLLLRLKKYSLRCLMDLTEVQTVVLLRNIRRLRRSTEMRKIVHRGAEDQEEDIRSSPERRQSAPETPLPERKTESTPVAIPSFDSSQSYRMRTQNETPLAVPVNKSRLEF